VNERMDLGSCVRSAFRSGDSSDGGMVYVVERASSPPGMEIKLLPANAEPHFVLCPTMHEPYDI
jgi:hypothetical protein